MQFEDQEMTIDSVFGPLRVVVTGEALHVLWGEGVGPQDGPGLIEDNRDMLTQIATMKFEADEGEPDGTVRLTGLDIEN